MPPSVTQIDARNSQGFLNQPSGPVNQVFGNQQNFNSGRDINVGGDVVGRDKITTNINTGDQINVGNITDSSVIAIGPGARAVTTGGGAYVGGDVHVGEGGKFVGRDEHIVMTSPTQSITPEQFIILVRELRAAVAAAPLADDERQAVEQDIAGMESQLQKPEPKLTLIKRGLNNIQAVIEAATGVGSAAAAISPLVQHGLEMAQQLFK